jgi:3-oxoadipate enol-lactonase
MIASRHIDVKPASGRPAAKIAVHMSGKGPLAILIHGFPLDHRMWRNVLNGELQQHRTLCAVDLRGHGVSPYCGDDMHTMSGFAEDIACIIKSFGDEPVDVCGLSMGGYIAFALHADQPELVRSLVLTNTRAAADTDAQREVRNTAIEAVQANGAAVMADAMIPKLLANKATEQQQTELRSMIENVPSDSIIADQRGLQQRPDRRQELQHIAVPTMVLVGSEDAITSEQEAIEMANMIPNAQLNVIRDTGHMSPMEAPEAWSRAVSHLWC